LFAPCGRRKVHKNADIGPKRLRESGQHWWHLHGHKVPHSLLVALSDHSPPPPPPATATAAVPHAQSLARPQDIEVLPAV